MSEVDNLIEQAHAGNLYAFGALPSALSTSDYSFAPKPGAGPVPATFMHPAYRKIPVHNQQGSTCVGNSISTCLAYLEYVANKKVVGFNGEEINAAIIHKQGEAISPHDGLDFLIKYGVDMQGTTYYLQGYAAVDHTSVDAVKAAMSSPNTVLTASCWLLSNFGDGGGTRTDSAGNVYKVSNGTEYVHDIPSENPWSYHQLTFVGYDDKGVIFQNSWGTGWADGGFARFAWDYVTSNRIGELWAVTSDLTNTSNYVKTYVAPTQPVGRSVRRVGTPATYLVYDNGLVWIQSVAQAKALGVDLNKTEQLPLTDMTWLLPVIGPDAPDKYK